MNTDRELLEFAAKAAGIAVMRSRLDDKIHKDMLVRQSSRNPYHENGPWNPLTDDGDALRLAVKLGLVVCVLRSINLTGVYLPAEHIGGKYDITEHHNGDHYAATRRAIVRAAAEIGKGMK